MIIKNVEPPCTWDEFPQGQLMRTLLEHRLASIWPNCFGYHLLKVGHLSAQIKSDDCPIKHQIRVTPEGKNSGVIAKPEALPFRENSVDAVLLANCLEYSEHPHQLIREAHRVLIPEGHLIICGFNPVSLLGLRHNNPFALDKSIWRANLFRSSRISDWLTVLGAKVETVERIFIKREGQSSNKLVRACHHGSDRYLSRLAGMYLLVAKKQEMPMTLIKPAWRVKPHFATSKIPTFNHVGDLASSEVVNMRDYARPVKPKHRD